MPKQKKVGSFVYLTSEQQKQMCFKLQDALVVLLNEYNIAGSCGNCDLYRELQEAFARAAIPNTLKRYDRIGREKIAFYKTLPPGDRRDYVTAGDLDYWSSGNRHWETQQARKALEGLVKFNMWKKERPSKGPIRYKPINK